VPLTTDNALAAALSALAAPGVPVETAIVPAKAGLYAMHASDTTWRELGLGEPPDARPLYAGKAERSLAGRDIGTHFSTGRTGSSTLRRGLAGLLARQLDLHGRPRNIASPGHFANFGLEPDGDARLTEWMHRHLRIAVWPATEGVSLDPLETLVLQSLQPPLNLAKVSTSWRPAVSAARARLAAEARAWRPADAP
jgi:hypothetical protein